MSSLNQNKVNNSRDGQKWQRVIADTEQLILESKDDSKRQKRLRSALETFKNALREGMPYPTPRSDISTQ